MSTSSARVLTTSGVLLGALTGAAAASVLYGVLDANGFGLTIFRSRLAMLLVGIGTLPFFTLVGAIVGGVGMRRLAPGLAVRATSSSPSA